MLKQGSISDMSLKTVCPLNTVSHLNQHILFIGSLLQSPTNLRALPILI